MQKITPFLWFNNNAEEAVNLYVSIFKNSRILEAARYTEGSPGPVGQVMTMSFELEGQKFSALNGGPVFSFTPAISFYVDCKTQAEVDDYWEKLSAGGGKGQCGWLTDKFGVSWQIIPDTLGKLLSDKDANKAGRVMQAMLKMTKLDIQQLTDAYNGK